MDCSPPGSSVHGIFLARVLVVRCYARLQGIIPPQGLNLCHSAAVFFTNEPLREAPSPVQFSSVAQSCAILCRSREATKGAQGSEQKAALQPAVTTSPWQGACPSCLYTEVVECTFPFSLEMVGYFCSHGKYYASLP